MSIFASYDQLKLWYEVTGEGAPLVVLPGGPGMDLRYLGDLGGLSRSRRLHLLDARAAGRSEIPADRATVSFTEQARDLEEFRRHLGLERLDVLAHSAGCLTAQEYAARFPGRLRRLVLVTPVGRASREPAPAEIAALRAARSAEPWYPEAAEAERLIARGDGSAELPGRLAPFFWYRWTEDRRHEYRPEHATALPWLREAFYAGSATPATAADRHARLAGRELADTTQDEAPATEQAPAPAGPTLSEPRPAVLVIAGAADGMIGTAPARLVAGCHPGSRLELMERSGHRPWAEEPERFRELVTGFLDTAPAEAHVHEVIAR